MNTEYDKALIRSLIRQADDMGFKKGTHYKRTTVHEGKTIVQEETAEHRAEYFHTYPDERGITLHCGMSQGLIFCGGKWIVEITGQTNYY